MNTRAFGTLRKSTVLPDSEMDRGQEHDGKAVYRDSWVPEEIPQDNVSKIWTSNLTGAELNPISPNAKADDKEMNEINQSSFIPNSEKELIHSERIRSKDDNNNEESTTGSPKSGDRQGDGEPIVGRERTQLTNEGVKRNQPAKTRAEATVHVDKAGSSLTAALVSPKLKTRDHEMYRKMLNEDIFLAAYHRMKSKPGNMTPGSDSETLDGISLKKIRDIIATLRDQSFQFRPVRRTFIPKANGKTRPLGIPCPMDKLVQEVMRILLEETFEKEFLDCSHGFRPGKGCHTALKQLSQ